MNNRGLATALYAVGAGVCLLALLWWAVFYGNLARELGGKIGDAFPCFFATTGGCAMVSGLARFAGYTPYNPALLYFGLLALAAGAVAHATATGSDGHRDARSAHSPGQPPYDNAAWEALLRFDPDIKQAADTIAPLGLRWTNELAKAYLALNDKRYLPSILQRLTEEARAAAAAEASNPNLVVEQGEINSRKWKKLANGQYECETLVGWKRFASLDEYRRYMGA